MMRTNVRNHCAASTIISPQNADRGIRIVLAAHNPTYALREEYHALLGPSYRTSRSNCWG